MITGIISKHLGDGKTTLLTKIAYNSYCKGSQIYSNYLLRFPHTEIETVEDVDNIRDGVLCCADFWEWLNARQSMHGKNISITEALLNSRHRKFDVYWDTQHPKLIDWIVEGITDYWLLPSFRNADLEVYEKKNNEGLIIYKKWFRPKDYWNLFNTYEDAKKVKHNQVDSLDKHIAVLQKDEVYSQLSTVGSKKAYIKRKFNVPQDDAYLIMDLMKQ